MKKIFFMIGSLGGGGAERVLLTLSKKLSELGYSVTIQVVYSGGILESEVSDNVEMIHVNNLLTRNFKSRYIIILKNLILKFLPAKLLYKIFVKKKYDIEIAFVEGLSTKIVSGSDNKKIYAWYHTNPYVCTYSKNSYLSLNSERKAYARFKKLICVSNDIAKACEKRYKVCCDVLFNPVDRDTILLKSKEKIQCAVEKHSQDEFIFVTVGRLVPEKGFDRLLYSVQHLLKDGYNLRCVIIGTGPLEQDLKKLTFDLEIENKIDYIGFLNNPFPILSSSDAFICSSLTEGMSTAVTEAVILGMPVITTDCPGMRDIFGDCKCGLIVENSINGIYEGMKSILDSKEKQIEYKNNSLARSMDFDIENTVKKIIDCVVEK